MEERENSTKLALIESEARYRHLFENNLAAVFRSEVGGALLEVNRALVDIFGYNSVEELKKAKAHELYYSAAERYKYLRDLKKNGYVKNYQMRMRKKDGSEIWILENVMLVKETGTSKEYIEGTLIDITETKRIQTALQEREENYKSLIEHTPDGILIHNEKGEVIFANPAALNMVGFSSLDEMQDKKIFSYILPEYHDKIKSRKTEMNKGKEIPFIEIKIRRPNGKIVEVETKTNCITYHGRPSVEVVLHDISLQRQLERDQIRLQIEEEINRDLKREIASHIRTRQRLNASQKYTRLLIDSSIDMIFACDENGRITEFNQAAQNTFGYSFSQILNKDMSVLYEDKEQYSALKKIISEDEIFFGEIKQIKKSGEAFPAFISASLLKNDKGEIIGMMSVSRDITHTKEAETQLKKSVHEKEILLKEIHHRVKNNLQVISSILKLQGAYVKDKKTRDLLNECRNRISSMAFIHATLYMTKDFANINFAEYVANLAGNLQQSYAGKDKKILLWLDIPKVFLHIDDAIPCGLIINEFLSNSFKYAFAKKKKGTIGISVKVKKENIILAIWDDGSGFPQQVDYRNTESLGLQLVISLVEQLRGKIKMESKNNKGTKFIIAFRKSK
ncbi:MAG: PAS domain S-box protein [Bacteroidetes bacterium]|nr:PAS domain S-box protein [Bacteroidota bacterium]